MPSNRFIPLTSSIAGAVPTASFMYNGELAINIADGKLFTRSGSNIILLAQNIISTYVTTTAEYFTGSGVLTTFALSRPYDSSSIFVSVGGLNQTNFDDYTLSNTTLTFAVAPISQSIIGVRGLVNVSNNASGTFSGSFFGTASNVMSSSYALSASAVIGVVSSASFATTASYASNYAVGKAIAFSLIF